MNRLTRVPFQRRPDDSLENYKVKNNNRDWETSLQNCINKLGKLEDLEEQLGCPLEVVFKALEEGIIINNTLEKSPSLLKLNSINKWCFEMRAEIYFLSDYQKTWWLKGEKTNE